VLAAALWLAKSDPDALMLVAPSDHVIPDAGAFADALDAGAGAARAGRLVTFGITPDRAETGYGWLELSEVPNGGGEVLDLIRFVEKPDAENAQIMLDQGRFLWNAGIFLFSVQTILEAFRAHAPKMIAPVSDAVDQGRADLGFLRLAPDPWGQAEDISLDYAVMERAENLSVVPFSAGWSDLGDWHAVWREMARDGNGVATSGNALALECRDTLLRSEAEGMELVGIGLDGIVAVAMPDAVLVADASRSQEVKLAVAELKARGAKQAEAFPKDHRPWGWFETLVLGDRFQVKRIVVHPGAALSLQSHHHRSEHWIVVSGTARVTVDETVTLLSENQSVYIPLGAVHRMENPGKVPMVLIEVQTGVYLGEDDIIRYEDVYARD
ncbi:MAG: mannose-1-phosphate guanylyltransferase/mannose-6-phosphate isomerase, partial [Rhodobacter sp.]|nr:mannose-1-phosphate guanylyltransferase/mannose-6-phosphate isomerase [Rhodobacter sp.]